MNIRLILAAALAALIASTSSAQPPAQTPAQQEAARQRAAQQQALREEIARLSVSETKTLVKMRDGIGLSTDYWRPKGDGKAPVIFIRTPYNLQNPELTMIREALRRGYAIVYQNERGRYLSEGKFRILGYPQTDGYDMLSWIAAQPWSNGKVGTYGCSSPAEWQLALIAMKHPAHAAAVPQSAGAGIGRVGPYWEQGNWYRGGVPRTLFAPWLYDTEFLIQPPYPAGMSEQALREATRTAARKPRVDWSKHAFTLPVSGWLSSAGDPKGTFDDFINAKGPADRYWFDGGLYHDNMGWGVPTLFFNSWYDVSVGPNMALFTHAQKKAATKALRDEQYVVTGPSQHCAHNLLTQAYKSGDRPLGDARFAAMEEVWKFFDAKLKGETQRFPATTAKVRYYSMGDNAWKSSGTWPPRAAKPLTLYLSSNGRANSLSGDGALSWTKTGKQPADRFTYDPMKPVQTIGSGDCCNGGIVQPGAFDQRPIEQRPDVLVYSTQPLKEAITIAGFIEAQLTVSSSARDTDFTVKLVDVAPDGTAYVLDDTILRARYREGFGREVFMKPGGIYRLKFSPMTTANTFLPGHRIRVEISSSNFPKYVRNLNTGGRNEFESKAVVADNTIHHSGAQSFITLPVVR